MRIRIILILCVCCLIPATAKADEIASLASQVRELTQLVKDLKLTVDQQQREITGLKQINELKSQAPAAPAVPIYQQPRPNKPFLEVGAVADVALKLDSPKVDQGGADRVSVRELELVLGSNVDPYSRLDATVAFNEQNTAELEEAYLTRFGLPLDLTVRIGRFKPRIGKDLALHRDSLDTVDEPLVIQRYFGEEGVNKSGVDVTKLIDIPSLMVHQLTVGVLEGGTGEGGTAFGSTKRRPTLYTHLKNYLDITDMTNLEIGVSDAIGSRDEDVTFEVNILGLDVTLIHYLNPNQSIKLQSEVFYQNRTESFTISEIPEGSGRFFKNDLDGTLWGGYELFDFRFNSQWALGFRFDDVELVDNPVTNPNKGDIGYSGYLTFYQSEFARWRVQFSHFDLATGKDDNQVLIQGTFAIGDHKHKLQ